ncbi:MAG: hypothetical protein CMC45_01100 [Flavobacteriaceae bacterium]|nr:hypothetical protein [Flavobacteriaceae bacterium]|tara:strand:- start:1545 stop:2234 length:690 start_codon:yes stop_codon:yes gene_type:complete
MLFENYSSFIEKFHKKGYKSYFFEEFDNKKNNQLIIRHDIDLDIDLALEIAQIENAINAKSTYFFLIRSESYNLLSIENIEKVKKIRDLGHKISIHFDLMIYKDVHEGLNKEIEIFENFFDEKIEIISIHRPNKDFLNNPENFFNVRTSYENKFTKDNISYFADSSGLFRFGNPLDSLDFKENQNIQLLTHPVWWTTNQNDVNSCVESVIENKNIKIREHFQKNIKTFK